MHAGADIVQISDPASPGNVVSVKVGEKFALPYAKRVVKAIKKMGVRVTIAPRENIDAKVRPAKGK